MKTRRTITAAILVAATVSCTQRTELSAEAKNACAYAAEVIDLDLKEYASVGQSGIGDDSAIREGNRLAAQQLALTEVQIQYEHMRVLGCPVTASMNLNRNTYFYAAMECRTEELKAQLRRPNEGEARCNRASWKPGLMAAPVPSASATSSPQPNRAQ
ncbi:MAG TPA: hypothetical protein VGM81_22305 [Burkholderiaceae bacterium]|jgi:hypothetical protein